MMECVATKVYRKTVETLPRECPCRRGHVGRKYKTGQCVECMRIKGRLRYEANKERSHTQSREWARANRARSNEIKAGWDERNPQKKKAIIRRAQAKSAQKIKAQRKIWISENKDKVRAWARRRRAVKRCAEGVHTGEDIVRLRARQGDRCVYCRVALNGGGEVDHIVSINAGGSEWPSNLQILCRTCNRRKFTHDPIVFANSMGLLL